MNTDSPTGETSTSANTPNKRSLARLGAVQALYQLKMADAKSTAPVVEEFRNHRLGKEIDGTQMGAADEEWFADVVEGVGERVRELDALIEGVLAKDWSINRLENIMLAILRAGVYEIVAHPDVPTAVIINEYVDIAHAFYSESEPGFVNGILDKLAKSSRS